MRLIIFGLIYGRQVSFAFLGDWRYCATVREVKMGVLQCCNLRQKTHTYVCDPPEGFVFQRLDYLGWCKQCKSTVLQVSRIDISSNVSYFRRTDEKAKELFERLKSSIRFKINDGAWGVQPRSSYWLGYNEFGKKKRCYSNFSSLQPLGESLMLPVEQEKILFSSKISCKRPSLVKTPPCSTANNDKKQNNSCLMAG